MLKMEKTCCSLKCNILHNGKNIGYMEGVYLTKWFVKNKYHFNGCFANFINKNEEFYVGITVDIIFSDYNLILKDARVGWINSFGGNGTFSASRMEHYDPSI